MYQPIRLFWNLAAIGGATAVGVITHDAGLTALTFIGGLVAPRLLGLVPRRGFFGARTGRCGPWGGRRFEGMDAWHRRAHEEA